jgi:recombination protein RecA
MSKIDPVKAVLEGITKRLGKGTAHLLSEGADSDIEEVIPTGIDVLDHHVLGIGGWPVGRIVELFAGEGDGKSSLLFQTIAGVQREGGIAALAETEHAMDSSRAQVFGCNLDNVILAQPDTMEETLQFLEATLESFPRTKKGDPPNFLGWDSFAATPTKKEIEEGLDFKAAMGDRAKMMSTAMRVLTQLTTERRALFMIVNQTRADIGKWGGGKTTPGGSALKFHASVRLELFSGKSVKVGTDHVGKQVTMMAAKTKIGGKPWAKAKVRLYYDTGWSNTWSTVDYAKDRKLIPNNTAATKKAYVDTCEVLKWKPGFAGNSVEAEGDVEEHDDALTGIAEGDME